MKKGIEVNGIHLTDVAIQVIKDWQGSGESVSMFFRGALDLLVDVLLSDEISESLDSEIILSNVRLLRWIRSDIAKISDTDSK